HRKVILRLPVRRDGTVGKSEVFVDMSAELPGEDALDGMKIDVQGNLYVTAPDGVRIYSPAGRDLGTINVPRPLQNRAWGGASGRTLYLCATDRLYRIDVLISGPLPEMNASHDRSIEHAHSPAASVLGRDVLSGFAESSKREWLVTNGIGGFAAGTL